MLVVYPKAWQCWISYTLFHSIRLRNIEALIYFSNSREHCNNQSQSPARLDPGALLLFRCHLVYQGTLCRLRLVCRTLLYRSSSYLLPIGRKMEGGRDEKEMEYGKGGNESVCCLVPENGKSFVFLPLTYGNLLLIVPPFSHTITLLQTLFQILFPFLFLSSITDTTTDISSLSILSLPSFVILFLRFYSVSPPKFSFFPPRL